jgi:glycosyltransferase involved in cell wall biosynthesis
MSDVVTLAGQQHEIDSYYAIADTFLLPFLSERCPNVLLEAMAAGVSVVATAVGGIPEVVTNGTHAILVKKHDGARMASATIELLKDRRLRDRLVSNAGEVVSRESPEAYFRSITSVLSQVCAHDQ